MRRVFLSGLIGLAVCALLSTVALAGGHNPADFPLRVHIFQHSSYSLYAHRSLDQVDGEGRANLFENGQPRGFDFRYDCGSRLMNSVGYETYRARWKKQDKTLEILLPAMGGTCDLKVEMKENVVYRRHNNSLGEVPAAKFKEWMEKHQYDPEHGKDLPVTADSEPAASGEAGVGASAQK